MKESYIIAIGGSNADGHNLYNYVGTEDEVKRLLLNLVKESRENDKEGYTHGTETVDEIQSRPEEFYAYASFYDYHIDYTARKVSAMQWIDVEGKVA